MLPAREHASLVAGYWLGPRLCRRVELRELTGEDELEIAEARGAHSVARLVSELLARCVVELEGVDEVTPAVMAGLTVGDREALLLRLRRLCFGDRIPGFTHCPRPSCGEQLDIELSISELLLPAVELPREQHELELDGDDGRLRVVFRLPTGADQEAAAQAIADGAAQPELVLLRRCVLRVESLDGQVVDWEPEQLEALGEHMATLDPQAELRLEARCPSCDHEIATVLDAATLLLEELATSSQDVFREVHTLALHYHWRERDILGMSRSRRRRYLGLLAEELA